VKDPPELEALRRRIDEIDQKLLELVAARVRVVLEVGDYKRRHGLAVYDPERERTLLERLCAVPPEPLDRETVRRVFERLVDESRRIEQRQVGHAAAANQNVRRR
jgi:chorismate mutase